MKHKQCLLKLYRRKIQEMNEDISLLGLLEIVCNEISDDKNDCEYEVLKTVYHENGQHSRTKRGILLKEL